MSECRRKEGREGERRGGREREEGGKGKQDIRVVSYPRVIQKDNGELGEVVNMHMAEVEIVYACSAE